MMSTVFTAVSDQAILQLTLQDVRVGLCYRQHHHVPDSGRLRQATYEHPQLEHLHQHTVMDSALQRDTQTPVIGSHSLLSWLRGTVVDVCL